MLPFWQCNCILLLKKTPLIFNRFVNKCIRDLSSKGRTANSSTSGDTLHGCLKNVLLGVCAIVHCRVLQTDGKKVRQLKQNAVHSHILFTSKVNSAGPTSKGHCQDKVITKIKKKNPGPLLPINSIVPKTNSRNKLCSTRRGQRLHTYINCLSNQLCVFR